ncbi:hypothetical protein FS749_015379, partial [Ceratobasidium sp. UAMH 11750]
MVVRKSSVIDASESLRLTQRIEQLEALVRASYGHAADPANMSEADMAALLSASPAAQAMSPQSQPPPERAVQDAAAALGQLSQGTGDNPLAALLSQFGASKSSLGEPNPADPVASFPASPHVTGQLARYFFEASSIHWYCVAVHKPVFYDAYLEFFSGRQQTVPDLDFCVLLAIMCALTLQFCGDADAQAELIEERELVSHPLNQPTEHTFQLLQITWARVIGEISDHCFGTLTPTYRTVLHMEHEIRIFEVSLPSAFRPGSGETGARPYILFQNQILMLQVHHARVLLLRPFVFKRDVPPYESENQQSQELFDQYACDVCIQVCKRLLAFQQIMHSQLPKHQLRWFLCVNSAFDAALTLASVLILQPDHPLAEDIDYWVRAGQNLLRSMSSFHHVASESVKALHMVRNRSLTTRSLLPVEGDGFNPPPVSINVPPQHYSPQHPHHLFDPLLSAEMDRAHRTLGQSPVLVADSLGPAEMSNAVWDRLVAQVFETGVLPSSVEMLSG